MTAVMDAIRRDAIAQYGVVGAPPEADLEGLVQLAATIAEVPTAVINIIDDRHQHQIAAIGFQADVCTREDSMCATVLADCTRVVVADARIDARFADNPFVTGAIASVRFYASSPLVTPSGVTIGTLCVFDDAVGGLSPQQAVGLDLLARQVVELLELRRITRALAASNEQLESFAGQISHDLRNPLTALTGFIELAADSPELEGAPHASQSLARAESAAARMDAMLANLLSYARIGGATPRREDVHLPAVVQATLEDLDAAIVRQNATVTIEAELRILGDPTLLRVLFQNLIANAVKFAAATGAAPLVHIAADETEDAWRIRVEDNGPGVPADERERVFGLMERGSAVSADGIGVGLSTCRRVVETHGGAIGIGESALGGASVWVVLPRDGAA